MDLNLLQYERQIYTVFDLLSDVGGLTGILSLLFSVITSIWNFQSFENFMVSRLFKIQKPPNEIDQEANHFNKSYYIQ